MSETPKDWTWCRWFPPSYCKTHYHCAHYPDRICCTCGHDYERGLRRWLDYWWWRLRKGIVR
jgi:hypothetical protein